jgi:cation diffusion facilitator CzcD-associated flavoprotein CzcO
MTGNLTMNDKRPLTAVIVGSGFGGIGMAIKLRDAGISDFLLFEKSDQVGGTWHYNTYPGAACDVPSPLYSFSFEQDFDWPRFYSGQQDIHRYQQHCVAKYGLTQHLRLNSEIRRAAFDEASGLWKIETTGGDKVLARALISATGQLNRPAYPKIPGLDSFRGKVFHSSRWDHAHDFSGRRVAVIGTGASAIQFVPHVVAKAGHVTLFQRTAPYVLPKLDRRITRFEHWLHRRVPPLRKLVRALIYTTFETIGVGLLKYRPLLAPMRALWSLHLRLTIKDPELRRKLTPDYPLGCKRVLFDSNYYPALVKPNVNVVAEGIQAIGEDFVLTKDGTRHGIDTLILGTGFTASGFLAPMEIHGRNGEELSAAWRDGAEAYLGITVTGFPNLFMLYGPNTNLGHNSIIYMLESQIRYVVNAIKELRAAPATCLDVKPGIQHRFNQRLQQALSNSVWSEGCRSWYMTQSGKIINNWSGFTFTYRHLTRQFDAFNYQRLVTKAAEQPVAIGPANAMILAYEAPRCALSEV